MQADTDADRIRWHVLRVMLVVLILVPGLGSASAIAQPYDLLLKGGQVIDPKNGMNGPMDLAITGERIARVATDIPASEAATVIDASGLYVAPGLIDPHAHVFFGSDPGKSFAGGTGSVAPDAFSFRSGVTTVVDAGDAGWRNFPEFKRRVIDESETRVLAFLNIFGDGLTSGSGRYQMDDINIDKIRAMIQAHPDLIVGMRVGHFLGESWRPVESALQAARGTGRPLLLECHLPGLPLSGLLERIRPGDIVTHAFGEVSDRTPILDENGQLRPYVREAREKGILFDVGPGGGSFHFSQAIPALRQGLWPDTFGTDLHRYSMNGPMKNMLNILSTYLNLGMSLEDVIAGGTWKAARAIQRSDLGHLDEGTVADVVVLARRTGEYGYVDSGGTRISGDEKLEAALTLRAGRVVWDQNGLAATPREDEE